MAAITYAVGDNWGSGFIGTMTVPGGTQGLSGWTLEFDAAFLITNLWGAEIVSHVGNHYVIRNASWNATVAANGQASFGFQATAGAGGDTAAGGFTLNGAPDTSSPPALPTLSIDDPSIAEGDSGTAQMTFTVRLSQAAAGPVTVGYATTDGTAAAGGDYTARSGTLTFAAGETVKTFTVPIAGDTTVEGNETFQVTLSGASGATIADGSATGTIVNNDTAPPPPPPPPPSGGDGASLAYHVASNWGSGFTATMDVGAGATALGGWTAEFDASFTITNLWNAVIVSHVGNHYVVRNAGWNGSVGAGQSTSFGFQATPGSDGTAATGFRINGADAGGGTPPVLPTLSVADASVAEGNSGTHDLAFTVILSAAATTPVTVAYATGNGTATAGSDYAAQTGTLTFAVGETSKVVHVQVAGDTAVEANEALTLTLSSPSGATLAQATATGTILNDDTTPLPTLAVADAAVAEGHGGGQDLAFTVTLSTAATTPITVAYATANGTGTAGSDYTAQSGTLTFAAGETSKVVHVDVAGDTAVEANETLTLTLSSPSGATLAQATATGTILNDDAAPLPSLAISDTSVTEGNPGSGGGAAGFFSTAGNQIVDSAGQPVQIAGVNWFGFESSTLAPHGLWTRGYQDMMDQMKELGFNTIRLPFSNDTFHSGGTPNGIDFFQNPDLQGLSALQIMDKIVDYAGEIGLRIILDHHRNDSGPGPSSNGLWYDDQHSEAQWIADWQMLAERYAGNPTVIGADLHNEPFNGTWGGGGPTDWAAAAERAGDAIGSVNPDWLIFVEGVATYQGQSYWWGGNLMGVADRPIDIAVDNKLVYSAHDYPNSVYAQPWFQGSDFPANLPAKFDQMWGYIYKEGIAPVYIGEFGTSLIDPKDAPWLDAITAYLAGDLDNNGTTDIPAGSLGVSWTYWSWNPNSGDTGGILGDDWRSVNQNKLAYLTPIEFDFGDGSGDAGGDSGAQATFLVSLSAPSADTVTVDYHTVPGEAGSADFTAASGTVIFAPGEVSKTIAIAITPDLLVEGNEHFSVVLDNIHGATLGDGIGVATILDDDTASTPAPTPDPTPTPAPTPEPTPTPGPAGSFIASFALVDSWSGGFNGSVVVHNDGAATTDWQIAIDTAYQITDIWNARIVSHDASGYVIGAAAWNGTLAHDGETSFGFIASGQYSAAAIEVHGLGDDATVPAATFLHDDVL
ncbi:Calx-beta domain-containing protein [Reyranella sp.]|uniref:Calx-beta domain-containing protein n=1 Tax=Reyranella sp. TaxID=1929291 RepID=UPI003BAA3C90